MKMRLNEFCWNFTERKRGRRDGERERIETGEREREKEIEISATVCLSRQCIFEITVFEATPI